jgi:hypothetical protein
MRQQVAILPDKRRLHLQDGPIDLIVEAFGAPDEVRRAYAAAVVRFTTILDELCAELPVCAPSMPRVLPARRRGGATHVGVRRRSPPKAHHADGRGRRRGRARSSPR